MSPRRRKHNLTIADIAAEAGVSIATVSRVLNNVDHPVSPATRKRVLAIAERHKYAGNIYGRGLAGQSKVIGLCVGASLSVDPGFALSVARAIDGLRGVTRSHGYHVLLESDDSTAGESTADVFFAGVPLAGVIVVAPRRGNPLIPYLTERGIPFIVLGSRQYADAHYVDADNRYAGREAVRYLAQRGRKRIAWIGGPRNFGPSLDMAAGLRAEVKRQGLAVKRAWRTTAEMHLEGGRSAARAILAASDRPNAVFCFTDFLAVGVLAAARELGIKVPEECAVIGYGDLPIGKAVAPKLTTFHHPDHEMAAEAARLLIENIIPSPRDESVHHTLFKPSLIVRETCGG